MTTPSASYHDELADVSEAMRHESALVIERSTQVRARAEALRARARAGREGAEASRDTMADWIENT